MTASDTAYAVLCGLKRGAQLAWGVKGRHLTRCPSWRGWIVMPEDDGEHVHVYPGRDLIIHIAADDDCPCGPTVTAEFREDGSNGWLVTHHSLDGREKSE